MLESEGSGNPVNAIAADSFQDSSCLKLSSKTAVPQKLLAAEPHSFMLGGDVEMIWYVAISCKSKWRC